LKLRDGTRQNLIYVVPLDKLPKAPGIYVFGRRWGKNAEALYVGKANKVQGRAA
jgi:excinuclease UvrABC nuclease subunit